MSESELSRFFCDARERARTRRERFGQAVFNHLAEVRPDLSEAIRGTDKDPFHAGREHPAWAKLATFLDENWTPPPSPDPEAA